MHKKDVIDLINANDHLSPEYGSQLTNHLPMAIYALHQIGASKQQITDFAKDHIKARRLRPLPAKNSIVFTEANYKNSLGQHDHYAAHTQYFTQQVKDNGLDATLKTHLAPLMSGVCGAAFHGLLRTSYGIMSKNEPEAIKGLAYWADTYKEITPQPAQLATNGASLKTLFDKARKLHQEGHWDHIKAGAPNIYSKIKRVADQSVFQDLITQSPLSSAICLDDFRDAALYLYESQPNFTSLHCLTAVHSLRHIYNKAAAPERLNAEMGSALIAAYLSIGAPKVHWADSAAPIDLDALKGDWEKLRNSSNDHAIKLAYSALEEYRDTGKDAYLHIIKNMVQPRP
jgi:hypothetical protein